MRLMANPAFRDKQEAGVYDPHVRPVNELVDELRDRDGRGWMPHVAPLHGGVHARLLVLLRDPGPGTHHDGGSGFLCIENDDPTAEALGRAFTGLGIPPSSYTPWNAYPWYVNTAPTTAQREAGVEPLLRLLDLLPELQVVLLCGNEAQDVWRRAVRRRPILERDLLPVETYHPGKQALFHPDKAVQAMRTQHRVDAYASVQAFLADL